MPDDPVDPVDPDVFHTLSLASRPQDRDGIDLTELSQSQSRAQLRLGGVASTGPDRGCLGVVSAANRDEGSDPVAVEAGPLQASRHTGPLHACLFLNWIGIKFRGTLGKYLRL